MSLITQGWCVLLSARLVWSRDAEPGLGSCSEPRVLTPGEPSGQSRVFVWELISLPRLPGGTGTLGICPTVLYFQLDVWFTAVPGNL